MSSWKARQRQAGPTIRPDRGQALVESALAFPLLLLLALALVQLALYVHTENVTIGACQDGARVASAADGTVSDGVATARALLRAGLGSSANEVRVVGTMGAGSVVLEAQGQLPLVLPWVGNPSLPLHARVLMTREGFHAGPGV
jgi:Flp pilus assembly protein TadG